MRPFRPLWRLAWLTTAGLALTAALLIVLPVLLVVHSRADVARLNSPDLTYADLDSLPSGNGFAEVLADALVPVVLLSFGLFVVWLYTARRNLDGFAGTRTKWGWGWIFAAWLVPVANLFAPGAVIADTARESWWSGTGGRPRWIGGLVWTGWLAVLAVLGAGSYATATRPPAATTVVIIAYLASSRSERVASSVREQYAAIIQPYTPAPLDVAVDALLVGIALGAIGLVWLVSTAQHRRAARIPE
jgi:hypothetical protein